MPIVVTLALCHQRQRIVTTPTTIAIVGATRPKGVAVAYELARKRCRLVLMSDDLSALNDLERNLAGLSAEILTQDCAKEACWEAEVIILAVNEADSLALAGKIKEVATGKTIICVPDRQATSMSSLSDRLALVMPFSRVIETTRVFTAVEWAIDKRNQNQNQYRVQLLIK